MDEVTKQRLKNKIIAKMLDKGYDYKPFEYLISVYITMLTHRSEVEKQLSECSDSSSILTDVLLQLNQDIQSYEELLLLD